MASIIDLHNIVPVIPQIMSDPQYVLVASLPSVSNEPKQHFFQELLKAFGPLLLGCITTFVAIGQFKLAKAQHALSHKQASISLAQKDIAEDKHRLELFEKRFEIYELFLNMAINCHKIKKISDIEIYDKAREHCENEKHLKFISDNFDKMISFGEASSFLFDENVKKILDEARGSIFWKHNLIISINVLQTKKSSSTSFVQNSLVDDEIKPQLHQIRQLNIFLEKFYVEELPTAMGPYLKMTPYLSKG